MDDTTLLRRYVEEHSESAFAELVQRHLGLVYFAALRQTSGDAALAEDVAQAVFADLARKAPRLTDRAALTGWLYTSTRFAARNARRGEQRRRAREQEVFAMQSIFHSDAAAHDWSRLRPWIDDALHTLDAVDREALLLRFFQGRAYAEIGTTLRVSEEAARKRIARALEKLARVLTRRGVTSTAAALAVALGAQAGLAPPSGLAATVTGGALAAAVGGGAKTGATFGAALLAFMNTTKFILGTAGLAVAGFGVAAVHARMERAARAELTTVVAQQETAEATVRDLERRFAAAEQRASAADADADQLLKAIQDTFPRFGLPPGEAACVAFVIDTSGSMRDPKSGQLWPAVMRSIREVLVAEPDAGFVMGFDADGRVLFGGATDWLPLNAETLSTIERTVASYRQDSRSNPVPGIYRAMRELPPPRQSGARLRVWVIGDEFIEQPEPVLRRLDERNAANAQGRRPATISAVQLPTTIRYLASMGNTGLKFQSLMSEVAREHAGTYRLLPPEALEP